MICAALLHSAFAAFVANRKECKLKAADRVSAAFGVVDKWRQEVQLAARMHDGPERELRARLAFDSLMTAELVAYRTLTPPTIVRPITRPPVHSPLPADRGGLALDALHVVFRLHAGCLRSFADDELTRLDRAYEIATEWCGVSDRIRVVDRFGDDRLDVTHRLYDPLVVWRRATWRKFTANLRESMITRIRKLSANFIPFGTFEGGRVHTEGCNKYVGIAQYVKKLHIRAGVEKLNVAMITRMIAAEKLSGRRASDPY